MDIDRALVVPDNVRLIEFQWTFPAHIENLRDNDLQIVPVKPLCLVLKPL